VRGSWKRSGWVTEKPGEYELVDYVCSRCQTRIGIETKLVEKPDLIRRILKTAQCRCR
jgi:hypothetical protein